MDDVVSLLSELDKLKSVYRRTYLIDTSRHENSAEHSWHLAMAILIFHSQYQLSFDVHKAVKLALVHDVCEIDAGDVSIHAPERSAQFKEELACMERISEQWGIPFAKEMKALWLEYERNETEESQWVKVMDLLLPFMMNFSAKGATWLEQGVSRSQVLAINTVVKEKAPKVYTWMLERIEEAVAKGWLQDA